MKVVRYSMIALCALSLGACAASGGVAGGPRGTAGYLNVSGSINPNRGGGYGYAQPGYQAQPAVVATSTTFVTTTTTTTTRRGCTRCDASGNEVEVECSE